RGARGERPHPGAGHSRHRHAPVGQGRHAARRRGRGRARRDGEEEAGECQGGRYMSSLRNGLTPRLKPLSARKSTLLSVLDVGTSKVVCLIAQLLPASDSDVLRRRTHQVRVLGIGHQRSLGLKGGIVVDLEAAEQAIRQAVDAAERMAKVEVQSVIVNLTGGRLAAQSFAANVATRGTVTSADVHRVLDAASAHSLKPGRVVLHALPTGYALDGQKGVLDPV